MRVVLFLVVGLLLVASPLFAEQAEEVAAVDVDGSSVDAEVSGKDMFAARCALCHQLPEPGMLKAKQWSFIVETMQQRMQQANMPQLNEQEKESILEFLSLNAR
jgi:mono/diheme cytochrome c family protein